MKKVILLSFFAAFFVNSLRAEPGMYHQRIADALFSIILLAESEDDYNSFVQLGTPEFKSMLTKKQFEVIFERTRSRSKGGYQTDSLGELNQNGLQVYLYRICFKAGGDDVLGILSVKNDKIANSEFK